MLTWRDVVPRVGMNWDVTGDGKTSLKAFFGIFGDTMGADFSQTYNPNSLITTQISLERPLRATAFNNVSFTSPNTSCDFRAGKRRLQHDRAGIISARAAE